MNIVTFKVGKEEFEHYVKRKAKRGELKEYARKIKQGIDAQLDWEMLYSISAENM